MAVTLPPDLRARLRHIHASRGRLVVLTGAGISAESGIPTFRGQDGYWVVGSKSYQPEEMATWSMFVRQPEVVWPWYLYRLGVCRNAQPNAGHRAVVEMEQCFGDRFRLITQNVDGLHLAAGSNPSRTYQVHGNIRSMRCLEACCRELWPLPEALAQPTRSQTLSEDEREQLRCPKCDAWTRPHVLWFDECYDEGFYKYDSSLAAGAKAQALIVVGTSGATNLPLQVGRTAAEAEALIIDINPQRNPFTHLAESTGGAFLQGSASDYLPAISALFTEMERTTSRT